MLKKAIKRSFIITVAVLQLAFFPHIGFAVDDSNTQKPITGTTSPTGVAAKTYTYNEETGLWENDYYTWDAATKKTTPKYKADYTFNEETGRWYTTEWVYSATVGKYRAVQVEATPPTSVTAAKAKQDKEKEQAAKAKDETQALKIADNDELASTDVTNTSTNNGNYNQSSNTNLNNSVNGAAVTGDAAVIGNTLAGNALSGDALSQATILNMLQSVWDPSGGDIATFTANIDGDVYGDLLIDPGQIPQHLDVSDDETNNLKINTSEDTSINNKIDLTADSGNATVAKNSKAGDATTGTAAAVANVVNLINSVIGSGQSFVGTININGNLNGDILLPQDMLDQLLASNVPRATLSTDSITNGDLLAEFNSNQTINNNITSDAASGAANVLKNSAAGNATTGSATNNVTILNLTGRDIIGSNAMLVFVNVQGTWVGMIMNAPGATSAVVGGGITSNSAKNLNADIESDSNHTINNDINLAAHSGNANVLGNSEAGNAKSGNASTSANIANVSNSHLSLGGWFGVLFINVFGSWLGSFGVNTSAGNKPAEAPTAAPDVKVFQFVPSATGATSLRSVPTNGNIGTGAPTDDGSVLGASISTPTAPIDNGTTFQSPDNIKIYLGLSVLTMIIMAAGKMFAFLKARRSI